VGDRDASQSRSPREDKGTTLVLGFSVFKSGGVERRSICQAGGFPFPKGDQPFEKKREDGKILRERGTTGQG